MNIGSELLVVGVLTVSFVWPMWRILGKAGFRPALAFISVIPGGALLLFFVLAFVEWPVERVAREAEYWLNSPPSTSGRPE